MSVQAMEMESLRTTSLQSYSRGREEGLQAGHSAAVAAYRASAEYAEEVFRQGSSSYADGFTVCAEQFKNLGNLPPDFDFNLLDMRAMALAGLGALALRRAEISRPFTSLRGVSFEGPRFSRPFFFLAESFTRGAEISRPFSFLLRVSLEGPRFRGLLLPCEEFLSKGQDFEAFSLSC
ncbi:hypothetical protein Salat_2441200 [Sesamum alatum]|uniref:Uncharacterized protein n=1 Tax=Sesamum alatum TaxID=300844 RepID=A0AAE1XY59_9LAMI|nr:hypothetical protein Salat_2441200 [Sesamum alatum]